MARSPQTQRIRNAEAQLKLMGWRLVRVGRGIVWRKYYPPPHEVTGRLSTLKVIGEQPDEVWTRDLSRALLLGITSG